MLTKTEKTYSLLFVILLILEIISGSNNNLQTWHYAAKPMILLSLIAFYWLHSKQITPKTRFLTILALVFSLFGDILLMFVEQSPHFFTLGLVSFLLAHIFYILVFLKVRNPNKKPWLFLSFLVIYAAGLFYVLKDNLGVMLLPVFFYMLIILTMAITANSRKGSVAKISFNFVFIGAILFLISDSLLAINKFYEPLPFSNISIMFTYAFAQFFIVFGLLKQQ
jgi:uncharacterized membrane protein YhhN